jgi:hypothetical protein
MTRATAIGRTRGPVPPFAGPVLVAIVLAACGTIQPSATTPGGSATVSPSIEVSASGSVAPGPTGTPWPGNAVLGIEALGAADGQIEAAINDFNTAVANEDLALMRRAADGLAGLDVLLPNLDKITFFEPMRPFADRYGAAIRAISAAASALRSAIDLGDAAGIGRSGQDLVAAFGQYTAVQPELATWVEQSIEQRRLLLR